MTDPKSLSAQRLADALDRVRAEPPDTFGLAAVMSRLEEAAVAFCSRSARVAEAYMPFGLARYAFQLSTAQGGYSAECWSRAAEAAGRLAAALRELGDLRIARCGAQTRWGTCGSPLDDSGLCEIADEHEGAQPGAILAGTVCSTCGRDTCTCGTCGGTGKVRLRRGGRFVQDCPHCERRRVELRVLDMADALDPGDHSVQAREIRGAAHSIATDYDPEVRDRVIWGGGPSPWVSVHPDDIDENGFFRGSPTPGED